MRSRSRLAVLPLLIVLAIAGCGGDDDESTTTADVAGSTTAGPALTADEFLLQGNAICKAGNEALDDAANSIFGGGEPTQAEIEQFAGVFVPSIQGQIDSIRTLVPPPEMADQVESFLTGAEAELAEVEADPSLLAASGGDGPFAETNAAAEELGLTECAG